MPETPEPTVVEAPKTFRKEYQPTNLDGTPAGPPQVFEAESESALIDKLADAHLHASRRINELRQQVVLEPEQPRVQLKPRSLTAEEKWDYSTKMSNPDTLEEGFDKLAEARFGAPVDKVRELLSISDEEREFLSVARGQRESQAFIDEHPSYKICPENQKALTDYISTKKLAWTKKNLNHAFEELQSDGLVKLNTPEAPVTKPTPTEAITSEAEPVAATRTRGTQATGLFAHNSSSSAVPKPSVDAFAEEISKMPSSEYRRRLADPKFRERVNALGKPAASQR